MDIDVTRGRPRIDPTMGRTQCSTHGEAAQSYIGRERYACWHCAVAAYERLVAAAQLGLRPADCKCQQWDDVTGESIPCYCD